MMKQVHEVIAIMDIHNEVTAVMKDNLVADYESKKKSDLLTFAIIEKLQKPLFDLPAICKHDWQNGDPPLCWGVVL